MTNTIGRRICKAIHYNTLQQKAGNGLNFIKLIIYLHKVVLCSYEKE